MKVYVNQIPEEGKFFEGEETSDVLELNDARARAKAVAPITYALQVGISDDGLWAHGEVGTKVECECVRCLTHFTRPLTVSNFAVQEPLEGRDTVDLTDHIREDILLALPAHPTCDWDGKTVCKASFTTAVNAAEPPVEDERWKGLDNLKL